MKAKAAGSKQAHGQRVFPDRALVLHFSSCVMFRFSAPRGTGICLEFVEGVFGLPDIVFNFVSFALSVPFGFFFWGFVDVFLGLSRNYILLRSSRSTRRFSR